MKCDKLCCEECIIYKFHHQLVEADRCYSCGKMAMRWKQNEYGTMCVECSECGEQGFVDMNTPCEYQHNSMYTCHIIPNEMSREKIYVISRLVGMTALDTLKKMKNEGIFLEDNFYEMSIKLISMDKANISYTVEPCDPRYKYTYIKNCGYPYRAIREVW